MNTNHDMTTGELSFEDIEHFTRRAHLLRSQAIAEMGAAFRSDAVRWMRDAMMTIRAAFVGNDAEKCA